MRLSDIDFIRLIPQFMREDKAVQGLAAGIDKIIPTLAASIQLLPSWDCIDYLSEKELDSLASELNILWYNNAADISVKRELIKNSDKVYAHLGTKWAVVECETRRNTYADVESSAEFLRSLKS